MPDATAALYGAMRAVLAADGAVSADIGVRIASDWASKLDYPFIRMRVGTVQPWNSECGDGSQYNAEMHIFTKERGHVDVSRIANAVRSALDGEPLSIPGQELWWFDCEGTIHDAPVEDPNLRHSIVRFTAATVKL